MAAGSEAETILAIGQSLSLAGSFAQVRGRASVGLRKVALNRRMLPYPEARATSRMGRRALVDQFLGEMKAPGLGHRDRACSQMFQEETPKMTGADAKARGQSVHAAVFERALGDQS